MSLSPSPKPPISRIAFTPAVKAAQAERGSRAAWSSVNGPSRSSRATSFGAHGILFLPRFDLTLCLVKSSPSPLRRRAEDRACARKGRISSAKKPLHPVRMQCAHGAPFAGAPRRTRTQTESPTERTQGGYE